MEKSVLIPTQRVICLSMVIDSLTMTFSLPEEKVSANCSKGNNSKEQESGIGEGNLQVYRNVLGYSPCSKGSSNPLSTASTPSDNLTERKFIFKKPMLLSEIDASPPCPARSRLVDTQSFHLNFKSNYTSSSRHLHSDRRF